MMDEPKTTDSSYYAIITADVLYDNDLSDAERVMYAIITSLCNQTGFCYASNKYFSERRGKSEGTISRIINSLRDKGYIIVNFVYKTDSREIEKRCITPVHMPKPITNFEYTPSSQMTTPPPQKCVPPLLKNVKENIKDITLKSNIKEYIEHAHVTEEEERIICEKISDPELREYLYAFIEMRNQKGKKYKVDSIILKGRINKLLKLSSDPEEQKAIVEATVTNKWLDFFELKDTKKLQKNRITTQPTYDTSSIEADSFKETLAFGGDL